MAKKTKKSQKRSWTRWVIALWLVVILPLGGFALLMVGISEGMFGELPSFEELENPKSNQASQIFSGDHKLLGKYFKENRINVSYDHLSPYLKQALIATEDERFNDHSGVDVRGIIRAVTYMGSKGGASTISQQLAKNLFPREKLSLPELILRKLKEWVIATRLERQYTKDEIIAWYFNTFDFINNAVGIQSAAQVYFNREPDSLSLVQSAMLVGMAQNPALYNPLKRPDITMKRREVVLSQMLKNKFITREVYDSIRVLPLGLDYKVVDHKEGLAPYFREVLRAYVSEILNQKDPNTGKYLYVDTEGNPYDLYKDGLRIYTTLDSKLQEYAEWSVTQHLSKELQDDFFKNLKKRKNYPFDSRITKAQVDQIMNGSMKRSDRYMILTGKQCANCGRRGRNMKKETVDGKTVFRCQADDCGFVRNATPVDSIPIIFNTPTPMRVFSWKGEIDTVMTPMDSIRYYKSFLQAGMMSVDPHTGFIKAWVGGIDYKHFAYDHVYQGKRQVGSTFKPIVYALAIQQGLEPCHEVANYPVIFEKERFNLPENWSPQNADGEYGGMLSLKYGLANSINTVTAWIMKQYGPQAVVNLARKMGITSHLDPVPSLCLGVADLSVYELTGATATFANKGIWLEPVFLTRIEDKFGNTIYNFHQKSEEPMSEETAYIMLQMLKAVANGACCNSKGKYSGTAMRLRGSSHPYANIHTPFGAKTGTTQNQSDGWFLGITPDLVTGVWVGCEDRSVRFSSLYLGQGANTALPIWGYYMNKIYADSTIDISQGDFEQPDQPISVNLNCKSYNQNKQQSSDPLDGFD
ncbi:MAG: transglycosylase domain-containing protein [Flavobacteriales bacterium]|nr:transglycosylase domain-containing protein [Flavobacteriales bacterium]MCB9449544.1 transglycosylase domain-containing protein [Flavobacteriales bacterium]